MNPGASTNPSRSTTSTSPPGSTPTDSMSPSATTTVAATAGAPVPSTTRPPRNANLAIGTSGATSDPAGAGSVRKLTLVSLDGERHVQGNERPASGAVLGEP